MSFRTAYGNSWSENGWRMVNRDSCILVPGPYMNTAPIREGAPAIILGDFARRYHVECAPIVSSVPFAPDPQIRSNPAVDDPPARRQAPGGKSPAPVRTPFPNRNPDTPLR